MSDDFADAKLDARHAQPRDGIRQKDSSLFSSKSLSERERARAAINFLAGCAFASGNDETTRRVALLIARSCGLDDSEPVPF